MSSQPNTISPEVHTPLGRVHTLAESRGLHHRSQPLDIEQTASWVYGEGVVLYRGCTNRRFFVRRNSSPVGCEQSSLIIVNSKRRGLEPVPRWRETGLNTLVSEDNVFLSPQASRNRNQRPTSHLLRAPPAPSQRRPDVAPRTTGRRRLGARAPQRRPPPAPRVLGLPCSERAAPVGARPAARACTSATGGRV